MRTAIVVIIIIGDKGKGSRGVLRPPGATIHPCSCRRQMTRGISIAATIRCWGGCGSANLRTRYIILMEESQAYIELSEEEEANYDGVIGARRGIRARHVKDGGNNDDADTRR